MKGVNLPSYLVASFFAGYAMLGVDIMLEGFLGLFGTYRDYMRVMEGWGVPEDQVFLLMAVGHQLNSLLLGFFFVHPKVYRRIPFEGFLKGAVFGLIWNFLALGFAGITGLLGAEFMKLIARADLESLVSLTLLHVIWGSVLGLLYDPPDTC